MSSSICKRVLQLLVQHFHVIAQVQIEYFTEQLRMLQISTIFYAFIEE